MLRTLVQTKLYIPPLRPNLVPRPHLFDKLNAGLSGKLTLVSAPAGFGKSTLLSHWISQSEINFCWVTLEENDNDIIRFLAYFIAALQTIDVAVGDQLLSLFHSSQQEQVEAVLVPLINQVAQTKNRFALVLDDYHLIESQDIHQGLSFWLEHQPPTMHLVIAGRSDPPLPLAKMRARREMTEIRESDLRFSIDESDNLLNQFLGLNLSREDIKAMVNRTEGWIAGLQLASIALQGKKDMSGYIQGFTGSQEYIADYLSDEVMNHQSKQVQEFLLKTSILEHLSSQLCDAVTEQKDSQQILQQLRSSNLFLTPLDDQGQWFRYHQLFADLLHQRLLESHADEVPHLYLKASRWFEEKDLLAEAIEYALRGSYFDRAIALLESAAEETIKSSEIATFMRWIEKIPEDLVRSSVTLSIYYAWALLIRNGRPQVAESYLESIVLQDSQVISRLMAVKSMLSMYQRQYPTAVSLASQALEELPEDDILFRDLAAWNLSAALFMSGDKAGGEAILEEVARVSLRRGNLLVAVIALCRLALARMQQGELHKPKELFQQALEIATDDQGNMLPVACEALIGLGTIHWEWNELDLAHEYLLEGIEFSKKWRQQPAITGYVTLAHLNQSQGDVTLAGQMMEKAKALASGTVATEADDRYVALQQAHLWLQQGNLPAARRWAHECGFDDDTYQRELQTSDNIGADLIRHYELIVLARILIAGKRLAEALELVDRIFPFMEKMGILEKMVEIHILKAIIYRGLVKSNRANSSLATAVSLAKPEGHIRPFLEEGSVLVRILKSVAAQRVETEFIQDILSAAFDSPSASIKHGKRLELLEPLSDRELEVLQLLATDLTVPEMADKMYLAVSTVRSHVKNIYGKLNVHSRYEAVHKAQEYGLL
jgi:LuxR family maltose regulon positive regulatory protein